MSSSSKKEIDYKELFGDMTYAELKAWEKDHDDEWNKDVPKWADQYWLSLEEAADREFPAMSLLELIPIWEKMGEGEYETAGDICLEYMRRSEPFASFRDEVGELQSAIKRIQMSVEVLLKEEETNQVPFEKRANITPAQLSRLKGGL